MANLPYKVEVFTMEILHHITSMVKVTKNGLTEQLILANIKWDKKKDMEFTNGPQDKDMKDTGKKM